MNKNTIDKKIFNEEIALCKKLFKSGKCAWGKCENCGVIPLLYKLYKGELLEDSEEIIEIKNKIFS